MTIKPLLESGSIAMKAYGIEADRVGAIVGKDVVEAGKLAESSLRGSMPVGSRENEPCPYALGFANMIETMFEKLNLVKKWFSENPRSRGGYSRGHSGSWFNGFGCIKSRRYFRIGIDQLGYGEWEVPRIWGKDGSRFAQYRGIESPAEAA